MKVPGPYALTGRGTGGRGKNAGGRKGVVRRWEDRKKDSTGKETNYRTPFGVSIQKKGDKVGESGRGNKMRPCDGEGGKTSWGESTVGGSKKGPKKAKAGGALHYPE